MQRENYSEKIDNYFKDKKNSDKYVIYLAVGLILAALIYLLMYDEAEQYFNQNNNQFLQTQSKLTKRTNELTTLKRENKVNRLQVDIKQQNTRLEELVYKDNYIKDKLTQLSYLLYNKKNWANFLDNLSKNAQSYKLEVDEISNKINEAKKYTIEKVLNVKMVLKGSFQNLIKFINSIEEQDLVVDVHKLDILKDKNDVNTSLEIAVWGMKY